MTSISGLEYIKSEEVAMERCFFIRISILFCDRKAIDSMNFRIKPDDQHSILEVESLATVLQFKDVYHP